MKRIISASVSVAALLAASTPAFATLQLSSNINGTLFSCVDNNAACDGNPTLGILSIADQTISGVEITGSVQTQTTGAGNSLNTSSLQIENTNGVAVPITVAVSGTDFVGPVVQVFSSGSDTFQSAIGSTVTLSFYADAANTQGADSPNDTPGTQLHTFSDTATTIADAFATASTDAFAAGGPYSMTLFTDGVLTAGGLLVNRGQVMVATAVPEPGSLALLGASLLGLGWLVRRRNAAHSSA